MKDKKKRFGIKLPNGEIVKFFFITITRNGRVYGFRGGNKHITILKEGEGFSSHLTSQEVERREHIGRISEADFLSNEDFFL